MSHTDALNETQTLSHLDPDYTSIRTSIKYLSNFFEQTCLHHQHTTAVICGSSQLTYLQLDRRANRLARLLLQRGLQENQTVGIYMERSINTYVSLLAVLKAGGAFVPLDPSFPANRVAFIVEDAALQDLLTTTMMREKTSGLSCRVLELDVATSELATYPSTDPGIRVSANALSYIIYTSGTTGQPKGVGISHANIANFLRVAPPIYGVKSEDRVYQGMSTAFDFSVEEIWPTWIAGATLVAGPTDSRRLGHGLTEFLIEQKITVLYCVPTLLATIDQDIPTVHTLLVGGEACPPDLVRRWTQPGRHILNTYGPTETTVTATWCELSPGRPVTIGIPLPSYHVYILDEQLCPVSRGECGEICIGGPGVAQGYINRPDLTMHKFILNPITSEKEKAPRLYRSGDLGRFTASGEIEYLGRIDTQVKIRGYRIELAEIEVVIREDEEVENAVVTPLLQDGVVQDLIAYMTLRKHRTGVAAVDVRARVSSSLRHRLPAYMVPAYIEVLTSFPLLAADKVNRKALPPPRTPRLGMLSRGAYSAPASALEQKVASIWEIDLGQERLSVESNFFTELGGHSLVAAQVISHLRQEPGLQGLSIGDLYTHPSIRSLSSFIENEGRQGPSIPQQNPQLLKRDTCQHSSTRVLGCGMLQLFSEYAMALLLGIPILWLPIALSSWTATLLLALGTFLFLSACSLLLPIVAGRVLLGNIHAGTYPLWGRVYLRWWLYRKFLALSPVGLLTGSPFFPSYLRLLGAKVGKESYFASGAVNLPMFLEIEDGVSIGYGVQLLPYSVEAGWLRLAPIHIGHEAFIGTNSVVQGGAIIENGATIGEQSLVAADQRIPCNEHWSGSPSTRQAKTPDILRLLKTTSTNRPWSIPLLAGFMGGICSLTLLPLLMGLPGLVLVGLLTIDVGPGWGLASAFIAGPLFVCLVCSLILLIKRLILPIVQPGIYAVRSGFGLRKWFSDQIMALSLGLTNTLYATLYLVPFLRLLGARIGVWSEISTVGHLDPDMLTVGDGSFVADIAVIGPAIFHRGYVALAPVGIGNRSFVGNGALLPCNCTMGANSLLGVHSVPGEQRIMAGTSWLGSPAIFLPTRQASQKFDENLTYAPGRSLVVWRYIIEYFRITMPATITTLIFLSASIITVNIALQLHPLELLLLFPLCLGGTGLASALVVILLKWIIVGTYRSRVEPLWSLFVRRSELITGLYETVAVPFLFRWLTGTPWIGPAMRLLGVKCGKRVWMDTTFLTEFDLVEIGDDAMIGASTSLQTHLFEDRVMKMSSIKIGARSSIGARSVVLYDAEVEPEASLDALSLVMKGERLPAESHWRGVPSRAI